MIDYRDFMQYAEIDLEISETAFKKKQYGNAAYHAQQALEKYLKSYFLKLNLIENVQNLGHLQYPEIINEAINILENQKRKEDNSLMIKLLDGTIKHYLTIKEMFTKVQQLQDKKILFWKASLGIELTTNEKNMLQGISKKNEQSTSQFIELLLDFVKNKDFLKMISNAESIPSELKANMHQALINFTEELSKNSGSGDARNKIISLLEPYLYGSGTESFSKSESDTITKLTAIDNSFDWYGHVLLSYPHQQIGRYPTSIDDKDAYSLYIEYKENLWKIIEEIRTVCTRIRNKITQS
ncbi:MAG: hypothetical protein NPMRTH1_1550016 [Nitrosopumilales archaeon]|nr:MAG: hypothetical protein NPMRTH1_1550016 [Nitrosopumilales archaeon]